MNDWSVGMGPARLNRQALYASVAPAYKFSRQYGQNTRGALAILRPYIR